MSRKEYNFPLWTKEATRLWDRIKKVTGKTTVTEAFTILTEKRLKAEKHERLIKQLKKLGVLDEVEISVDEEGNEMVVSL